MYCTVYYCTGSRMKEQKKYLLSMTRPEDMMMEMIRSLMMQGDLSIAALVHDDQLGKDHPL